MADILFIIIIILFVLLMIINNNRILQIYNLHKLQQNEDVLKELISVGLEDIDDRNENGFLPLHIAVNKQKYLRAESLLQNGARVNARNGQVLIPLAMAIKDLLPDIVKIFLDHKLNNISKKGKSSGGWI